MIYNKLLEHLVYRSYGLNNQCANQSKSKEKYLNNIAMDIYSLFSSLPSSPDMV